MTDEIEVGSYRITPSGSPLKFKLERYTGKSQKGAEAEWTLLVIQAACSKVALDPNHKDEFVNKMKSPKWELIADYPSLGDAEAAMLVMIKGPQLYSRDGTPEPRARGLTDEVP